MAASGAFGADGAAFLSASAFFTGSAFFSADLAGVAAGFAWVGVVALAAGLASVFFGVAGVVEACATGVAFGAGAFVASFFASFLTFLLSLILTGVSFFDFF